MGFSVSIFVMLAMIVGPFILRFIMRPKYQDEPMFDNPTSSDISMPEECASHNIQEPTPDFYVQQCDNSVQLNDAVVCAVVEDNADVEDGFHFDLRSAVIAQTILQNDYTE